MQGLAEEEAATSGFETSETSTELLDVGISEQRIEIINGTGRAEATEGGENDGNEGAAEDLAAVEMIVILFKGTGEKDGAHIPGGLGDVGREHMGQETVTSRATQGWAWR